MSVNIPQIMVGFLIWGLSIIFSYVFLVKLGGRLLEYFPQTSSLYWIFLIGRWVLFIFFAFILPYMLMQDKTILDKAIKMTGG